MRASTAILGLLSVCIGTSAVVRAAEGEGAAASARRTADRPPLAPELLNRLPAGYDANEGQFDERVRFVARTGGTAAWILDGEAVIQLGWDDEGCGAPTRPRPPSRAGGIVRMRYGGLRPRGDALLPGRSNYFLGDDASRWRSGVASFGRVRCDEIAPGVSLVWRGTRRALAYDLVVAPGADPAAAAIEFSGASSLAIDDATGDLVLVTERGATLRQSRPRCFQTVGGERREVDGAFAIHGRTVGFRVGDYDRSRELVIDPTFDGGAFIGGPGQDGAQAIAVGPTNDVYMAGVTGSTVFPLVTPFQSTQRGGLDAFVIRISADGTTVVYSTFLGGGADDAADGIVVGTQGDAYIVGQTRSTNFPVLNAIQPANGGGNDAFVTRLAATGATLVNSTYLGGSGDDRALGLALDAAQAQYVAGSTASINFPTASPRQAAYGTQTDGFLTKINPGATALVYSTYHGGSGADGIGDVAVDASGAAYVCGFTSSANLPVNNAYQAALNSAGPDAFVAKYNAAGSALVFGTYLGGSNADDAIGIGVDPAGAVYVCGSTASGSFPLVSPSQGLYGGGLLDGFAAKFSPSGAALTFSTFIGGSLSDTASAVVPDSIGGFFVVGLTSSVNLPASNALQPASAGGSSDMFVVRFPATGSAPTYSTYWGGNDRDDGLAATVDSNGSLVFCGTTFSSNFPMKGPIPTTYAGGLGDAGVTRFNPSVPNAPTNLAVTLENGILSRLTWGDASVNETGFEIERKVGTAAFTKYSSVASNVVTYDDASLLPLTLYTYRVRALGAEGGSAFTAEKSVTSGGSVPPPPVPRAPAALEAIVVSATEVNLAWEDKSNDETRFDVQRADGVGTLATVGSPAPDATAFADLSVPSGWPVTYRVRALATQGPSVFSQPVTVTTPGTLTLATVSGLVADSAKPAKDKLSWSGTFAPVAGANLTDILVSGLRLQIGPAAAQSVITVRANDAAWKVKKAKATWKSPKGALPKTTVVLDTAKATLTVSVTGLDFSDTPTSSFRVLAGAGGLSGSRTETWIAGKKLGTFAPPKP